MGTRFPYGTFVINCTGSFLIGFILTLLAERTHGSPNWRYLIPVGFIITLLAERTHWSANWRYLIPVGFIGAYTTFSTFEYETLRNIQDGELLVAGLNVILSVVVGFISVWLGVIAGRTIT
jgi:fluoride exporter